MGCFHKHWDGWGCFVIDGWLAAVSKGIRICAPHTCVPKLRSGLWRPQCVVSLRLSKHVRGEIELARDRGRDLWRDVLHLLDAHPGTPCQVCIRCPQRRRQWRRCNSSLYMIFPWQFPAQNQSYSLWESLGIINLWLTRDRWKLMPSTCGWTWHSLYMMSSLQLSSLGIEFTLNLVFSKEFMETCCFLLMWLDRGNICTVFFAVPSCEAELDFEPTNSGWRAVHLQVSSASGDITGNLDPQAVG